jgi:penicillin-binding protein 1B
MWTPTNFEDKKYADITIRKTIEDSVNTATTRLARKIGFRKLLKTARLAGINSSLLPVPSLVLGSFEVRPMELAMPMHHSIRGTLMYEVTAFRGYGAVGEKFIKKN